MPLTNYALDKFVAPKLSQLTEDNTLELNIVEVPWVNNFILNSIFGATFAPPYRQYILNFLRRVEGTIEHYSSGRLSLQEYIMLGSNHISKYMKAVTHFEICVSLNYQAFMLSKKIVGIEKLYLSKDGSELERLNILYNYTKHCENVIAQGQILEDHSIPLWLTNTSLESKDVALSYVELAGLIEILAKMSDKLSSLDNDNKVEASNTNGEL